MLGENQGAQILANIRGVLVADAAEWAQVTDPRLASAMLDMDAVRQAEQLGAVELREDDSGVLSVRLRPDYIRWTSLITVRQPEQVMKVDTYSATSKLDMVLHLRRHGWVEVESPAVVGPRGPFEFLLELRRPAPYFWALVNFEFLMCKHVKAIPHDRSDYFYRCLLRLTPDQIEKC